MLSRWPLPLALVLLGALAPRPAQAYAIVGNGEQALSQTGLRAVFADNGDGTITAWLDIDYDGPAERFGWIVPVPGVPEVGISSRAALDRLQGLTDPTYRVDAFPHGECEVRQPIAGVGPPYMADRPIAIFDSGETGPFDYLVVGPDASQDDPIGALIGWLEDGGLVSPELDRALLEEYLDAGHSLVVLRLSKDHDTGSIRPILLTYEAERPVLPLRLSAAVAEDDMEVRVWVLGATQAVSTNYPAVELNQARLDWFDPTPDYQPLVAEAVDEAGGQAFLTEFAAGAGALADGFVIAGREGFELFRDGSLGDPNVLVDASVLVFGDWDGFEEAVRQHAPDAADLDSGELLGCISCHVDDIDAFLDTLFNDVIDPVLSVHDALLTATTVTRFFTLIDGDEIEQDPEFDFNPDLEPLLPLHIARGALSCDYTFDVELEHGTRVRGTWGQWPSRDDLPAAVRVVQYNTSGTGEVLTDNSELIDAAFAPEDGAQAPGGDPGSADESDDEAADDAAAAAGPVDRGSICTASVGTRRTNTAAFVCVVALCLLARRRRRATR